jgi:hypothetical protein
MGHTNHLAFVPVLIQDRVMPRFAPDPALVSTTREALAQAPGWARVGLTFGSQRLREEALTALAETVAERLENPSAEQSADQLRLSL